MTGDELRIALRGIGISQKHLAKTLGVSPTTVWRWVTGHLETPLYAVAYIEAMREISTLRLILRHRGIAVPDEQTR